MTKGRREEGRERERRRGEGRKRQRRKWTERTRETKRDRESILLSSKNLKLSLSSISRVPNP